MADNMGTSSSCRLAGGESRNKYKMCAYLKPNKQTNKQISSSTTVASSVLSSSLLPRTGTRSLARSLTNENN